MKARSIPGVTEEICGPLIEQVSGLRRGERLLPRLLARADQSGRPRRIASTGSSRSSPGENEAVTDRLAAIYGAVTEAGVFRAASIKAAEAAKVIENAQRDINIAFMNEITQIFAKLDISIWDVLDAAGTKWNFLPFQPGLVGGHCIGVDPYYLSFRAQQLGLEPERHPRRPLDQRPDGRLGRRPASRTPRRQAGLGPGHGPGLQGECPGPAQQQGDRPDPAA